MSESKPLHILKLRIVNFLGVEDATIEAEGNSVVFRGENALGKTSRLKAIETLFRGASDRGVKGNVVMVGKERAELFAEIGTHPIGGERVVELTLRRSIPAEGKQETELLARGGIPVKKVQEFIEEAVDALQTNPVAFALEPDNRKKRELVLRALPLRIESREALMSELTERGFDGEDAENFVRLVASGITTRHTFDVYAALEKFAYDARTEVNREIRSTGEIIRGLDEAAPSVIYDAVQHSNALEAYQARTVAEQDCADAKAAIEKAERDLEAIRVELEQLDRRRRELIEHRKTSTEVHATAVALVRSTQAKLDVMYPLAQLRDEVVKWQGAQAVRESYAATVKRREDAARKLVALQLREQSLTRAVNLLRDVLPDEAVRRTRVPIDGLRVTKDGVEIAGRSIEHLSTREQIEVGVRLAVALMPPEGFKLLCVDRLESLDGKSRSHLFELAAEHQLQIFGTQVTDDEQLETSVLQ